MIKHVIFKLYNQSPRELLHQVRARLRKTRPANEDKGKELSNELRQRFMVYHTSNLKSQ